MKNILVVCADKVLRQEISKGLARELGFLYADIDEMLDYELLNANNVSIGDAGALMHELEQKSIKRALEFNNCVLTISRNLFVSNANFRMFDMAKIFVALPKSYFMAKIRSDNSRLEQELLLFDKINKLISINCQIVLERDVKTVEEICAEIIEKLKSIKQ